MDLKLLDKGLNYTKKKKKWLLILGTLGFTSYGAYKIYNLPCVVKKRQRLLKLFGALLSVAEMVSDSSEAIGILSKDLKEFLASDSNQIPQSLKQVSKITKSNEFSVVNQNHEGFDSRNSAGLSTSVDKKCFARSLVMAFYSGWQDEGGSNSDDDYVNRWIDVACDDKCRELIGDCVRVFVSTAVAIYLDKTTNINTYDEIFSGLTNPKHEAKVRDILSSVCNGAVETLIQTSHGVWSKNSIAASKLSNLTYSKIGFEDSFFSRDEKKYNLMDKNQDRGWVSKVSSTLAVPSNRKFILDMTGTVTFETVRSFLDFLLQKTLDCVRRNVDDVNQEVVDKGVEAIRYMSGQWPIMQTIFFSFFQLFFVEWVWNVGQRTGGQTGKGGLLDDMGGGTEVVVGTEAVVIFQLQFDLGSRWQRMMARVQGFFTLLG
ncbi:hypothetical protein BUALT_Bualt04G0098500 [Buddleja alternifolia]|uniref:Protein PHLOEM PROTEIN 2-LIKE A10 n=1 Tax=Buddleja alternifolia TaxID=168488 RepID=A0AAV6XP02_9LAMI|nr:hypothetical protein BUALT_Bualt04G0098500 [Buddleja alternifolia]